MPDDDKKPRPDRGTPPDPYTNVGPHSDRYMLEKKLNRVIDMLGDGFAKVDQRISKLEDRMCEMETALVAKTTRNSVVGSVAVAIGSCGFLVGIAAMVTAVVT